MKSRFSLLLMAAACTPALLVQAQTTPKPASPAAKSATSSTTAASVAKLPPGVLPARGLMKTTLALKYQDIKLGTGPLGKDNQIWHVKYSGWRAADGVIFDAWDKHPQPVIGPDGKPVMGPDNKPKMGDPTPMEFPHGIGRMIPGFDLAVEGMHVGGKRRIFIPWALAYGYRAIPDRGPDHPGIPAKSDLVFDVELVSVSDMPPPPAPRPGGPGMSPGMPGGAARPAQPGVPGQPGAPGQPAAPGQPPAPATAPAPAPNTATPPATTPPAPQPKPTTPPQSK